MIDLLHFGAIYEDRNDRMQIMQKLSEYDMITNYMKFMQQTTSSSSEEQRMSTW